MADRFENERDRDVGLRDLPLPTQTPGQLRRRRLQPIRQAAQAPAPRFENERDRDVGLRDIT